MFRTLKMSSMACRRTIRRAAEPPRAKEIGVLEQEKFYKKDFKINY